MGGGFRLDGTTISATKNNLKRSGDYVGGGFFGFFDAKYAVLKLGMTFGDYTVTFDGKELGKAALAYLDIDLLGKYPFGPVLNKKLLWYPMLGIGYMACLSSDSKGFEAADLGRFVVEGGIGADYAITPKLGVRADVVVGLFGFSKAEKDLFVSEDGAEAMPVVFKFDLALSYKLK